MHCCPAHHVSHISLATLGWLPSLYSAVDFSTPPSAQTHRDMHILPPLPLHPEGKSLTFGTRCPEKLCSQTQAWWTSRPPAQTGPIQEQCQGVSGLGTLTLTSERLLLPHALHWARCPPTPKGGPLKQWWGTKWHSCAWGNGRHLHLGDYAHVTQGTGKPSAHAACMHRVPRVLQMTLFQAACMN